MLKNITGTFFTRLVVSVLNFVIIILTAKLMGAEVRGSISLCMLAIAIAGLVNEIVGGPAIVYLIPRYENKHIAKLSYLWAVVVSISCSLILALLHFYEIQFLLMVSLCSLLLCTGSIHQFILLGHQKIKAFNYIALSQGIVMFLVFISFLLAEKNQIQSYFYSLLTAYAVSFILGLLLTRFIWNIKESLNVKPNLKILFNNGILTQLASLTHLMSSRVSFYFSGHFFSLAFVGVLSTAVSITEAAMLFSTSVALITASTVSNETDKIKASETTLKLIKLSLLISFATLLVLSIFPEKMMSEIFGKDFKGIKIIILSLIPGALANSISQVISHYYSGLGRFKINTTVGFISLSVSVLGGLLFLKTGTVLLPGVIISMSSTIAMIYFVRLFLYENELKMQHLIPGIPDIKLLFEKLKQKS